MNEQEFFIVATEPHLSIAIGPQADIGKGSREELPVFFTSRIDAELFAAEASMYSRYLDSKPTQYKVFRFVAVHQENKS